MLLTICVGFNVGDIPGGPCAPGVPVSPSKKKHVIN
jgi:hypothetical protein